MAWIIEWDVTSTWSREPNLWEGCMAIIQTWFWDDAQSWQDELFWFDTWSSWWSSWIIEL